MQDARPSLGTIAIFRGRPDHAGVLTRLRNIIRQVENRELSHEEILESLNDAADVMECIYINETKRFCEEDDELSEVATDSVPDEVRDWLATTFTRSLAAKNERLEKRKFRAVAQALRVGIHVDKLRRTPSSIGLRYPAKVVPLLKTAKLDSWAYDVFELNEASNNQALRFVAFELLQRYGLQNKYKINSASLEKFLAAIEAGYGRHSNPYHNMVHGADVTQTTHQLLAASKVIKWLTDIEILATIYAAAVHDYEHTGTTNLYHVNTGSDLALLYNDQAVLENHHISATFKLMKDDDMNILKNLSSDEYKEFRSLVITMVLATDMSHHFQQINTIKGLLSVPETIDKPKALSLVLHTADISHPAKPWELHYKWTMSLLEEFFRQGDREKELGLPVSPLCDRESLHVPESQIGFIDFIVEPSFNILGDMLEVIIPTEERGGSVNGDIGGVGAILEDDERPATSRPSTASSVKNGALGAGVNAEEPKPGRRRTPRAWEDPMAKNKKRWKDKSIQLQRQGQLFKAKSRSLSRKDTQSEGELVEKISDEKPVVAADAAPNANNDNKNDNSAKQNGNDEAKGLAPSS